MNKIYIKIPANAIAGGVESLYQLSDAINNVGGNSIIIWDRNLSNPVPNVYSGYNIKYGENVEDNEKNLIIYPEVWTEQIFEFKKIKKSIWWLSVDNNHNRFKDFQNENILHLYQSFYALDFLLKNNAKSYLPMFDYISESYLLENFDTNFKEDIVVYNPAKGINFTDEIINENKDITFIPIKGMNNRQIIDLLKISKIYIDFGNHPGRDRIPREAAYLGNLIVTNYQGSSKFYNDIPIPNKYKFHNHKNLNIVFKDFFLNYNTLINELELYRSLIKNQKEQLYNLCKQTFNIP